MTVHLLPTPVALITGDPDGQLDAALSISDRVFSGEPMSLQAMVVARKVIDCRTNAKATLALLDSYIAARRDEIRRDAASAAKRGNIRAALVDIAGLAFIVAVATAVYHMGMS
jgi:hypothetical protein